MPLTSVNVELSSDGQANIRLGTGVGGDGNRLDAGVVGAIPLVVVKLCTGL